MGSEKVGRVKGGKIGQREKRWGNGSVKGGEKVEGQWLRMETGSI